MSSVVCEHGNWGDFCFSFSRILSEWNCCLFMHVENHLLLNKCRLCYMTLTHFPKHNMLYMFDIIYPGKLFPFTLLWDAINVQRRIHHSLSRSYVLFTMSPSQIALWWPNLLGIFHEFNIALNIYSKLIRQNQRLCLIYFMHSSSVSKHNLAPPTHNTTWPTV